MALLAEGAHSACAASHNTPLLPSPFLSSTCRVRFDQPYLHPFTLPGGEEVKLTLHQQRFKQEGFASTVWDSSIVLVRSKAGVHACMGGVGVTMLCRLLSASSRAGPARLLTVTATLQTCLHATPPPHRPSISSGTIPASPTKNA